MGRVIGFVCACCLILGVGAAVAAESGDYSKLICVVIEPLECQENQGCKEVTVETLDIPRFVKIDMDEGKIVGVTPSGEPRSVDIRSLERLEGEIVMQGFQKRRAWSIVISEQNGKMTLSASSDEGAFVIFGACTPL